MKERNKVLVVGLDGATFDILRPWIEQGKLPILRKLMENGVSDSLTSTIPPMSSPAWPSFMTGKNPGKIGVFDFVERRPDSYDYTVVSSKSIDGKVLWNILSEAGKKVGIINVQVTYPPQEVNGFMISGMPAPSVRTHPASLLDELRKEVGEYRLRIEEVYGKGREDSFIEDLYRVTDIREKTTLFLMKKYDWDFFMVMFFGTEFVQHTFWSYMDHTHPDHDPQKSEKYGNVILEYFQKIDDIIGKIIKNTDENTTLIIMSDHGHGPLHKVLYINRWLMELGLLNFKRNILTRIKLWLCKYNLPVRLYDFSIKLGLGKLRKLVSQRRQTNLVNVFISFRDVDWLRTKAYSHGHIGSIFINLKGREPDGIVEPGKDYHKLRTYIIKKLCELRDPETGEKVVDKVFRKEEVYSGSYVDRAPDIIFIMKDMKYIAEFGSFGFHHDSLFGSPILRSTGTHRMNGIFIMKGKNVKRNSVVKGAKIIDLAPTILYLMGVPVPSDMDGKVLTDALYPSFVSSNPIRYEKVMKKPEEQFEWSDEEEKEVKERLRRLGYL